MALSGDIAQLASKTRTASLDSLKAFATLDMYRTVQGDICLSQAEMYVTVRLEFRSLPAKGSIDVKRPKKQKPTTADKGLPPVRSGRIAQARRAAVLKAAAHVFLTKGFGATSMADIIVEAGGSKASLYGHFQSKDKLFAAVMRHEIDQRSMLLFEVSEVSTNVEAALGSIGQRFLQLLLDDTSQALRRICLHEADKFPELGHVFFENGPKKVVDRLNEFLRHANDNGQLRVIDSESAAWQFILLCQAKYVYPFIMTGMAKPTTRQCQEAIRAAVRTFMAAFGPGA